MNRKQVVADIKKYSNKELSQWREHAVKCLNYYLKYRDDFEIEECQFVIEQIDLQIQQRLNKDNSENI